MQMEFVFISRARLNIFSPAPPTSLYIANEEWLTDVFNYFSLTENKRKTRNANESVTLLTHTQDKRSQYKYAS